MGEREGAVRASAICVHHTLRDALTVKMSEEIDVVEVYDTYKLDMRARVGERDLEEGEGHAGRCAQRRTAQRREPRLTWCRSRRPVS